MWHPVLRGARSWCRKPALRAFFVHTDVTECGKAVKGEGTSHAMRVTGTRYRIHQQNHGPISEEPHDF